jgi:hypothetical protein
MILNQFKVLSEIHDERSRQDEKWGGSAHDDWHDKEDWIMFIKHYLSGADLPMNNFREEMVKIAALAVAAIESYDRKNQKANQED